MSSIPNSTASHARYLGAATTWLGSSGGVLYASSPLLSSSNLWIASLVGVPLAGLSTGCFFIGGAMCCRYANPDSREEAVEEFNRSIDNMVSCVRNSCDHQTMR